MPLLVKKLDPRATVPTCNNPGEDLAYDLYALEDTLVLSGSVAKLRTGVALQHHTPIKAGLLIRDRSSMAAKGLYVAGGVIDAGYTGEVIVLMHYQQGLLEPQINMYNIKAGDKIAQVIPVPVLTGDVVEVNELSGTRGDKGFGSSGR